MVKIRYILIIFIAILLIPASFYVGQDVFLCKYPYCYKNAVVFTVDDIAISNEEQKNITMGIDNYFNSRNIPATFFAIPSEMERFEFSDNIEIAEHGLTHRNNIGIPAEFLGVSQNEKAYRILEGKKTLESLGYNIYGFRAPMYFFKRDDIKLLKSNFYYDSSFFFNYYIDKDFEIPIFPNDLSFFLCNDKKCNCFLTSVGIIEEEWVIAFNTILNRPILLSFHFWSLGKIIKNEEGIEYLDKVFRRVNNGDYWITTLIELKRWQDNIKQTKYYFDDEKNHLNIINPVTSETFIIKTKKNLTSNVNIECKIKGKYQICIIT